MNYLLPKFRYFYSKKQKKKLRIKINKKKIYIYKYIRHALMFDSKELVDA